MHRARVFVLLAGLMLVATHPGCGGGGDSLPPTLSGLSATPAELTYAGGAVTLSASVTDPGGVAGVSFVVTPPSSAATTLQGSVASGDVYQATYTAAANVASSAQTYALSVTATDAAGNVSAATTASFTVASAGSPPPPPIS